MTSNGSTPSIRMIIQLIFPACLLIVLDGSRWIAEGFHAAVVSPPRDSAEQAFRFAIRQHHHAVVQIPHKYKCRVRVLVRTQSTDTNYLESVAQGFSRCLKPCINEVAKVCKVKIAPVDSTSHRLGLVATESISKSEVVLAIPFDDRYELNGKSKLFQSYLPGSYNSWTGEAGMIALQILNEVALSGDSTTAIGIPIPTRSSSIQDLMQSWVLTLPNPAEYKDNPILWSEDDQEVLQSSTTNKIYKILDDIEEDAVWLTQNIFEKDRSRFPESVMLNGENVPCFSVDGYKWAMALSRSRSVFLDGTLRLIPFLDMCNHSDNAIEIRDGYMGTFGTIKGAQLVAAKNCKVGDEIFCSYGPKSAADYLLEYGFCPDQCWNAAVSEISLEIDPEDRFYDDKLDILEFETYDQAPMGPLQSFDVVSAPGRDGEPDKAMIQFARLCMLGSTDSFLLESIFRQECWGFMELPVSEKNELDVINMITEICHKALADFNDSPNGGPSICSKLRESERIALTRTIEYLQREKEALDLKEYYQERRLKDLGLDSSWSPEDEMDPDRAYGQTRTPGGADYDW